MDFTYNACRLCPRKCGADRAEGTAKRPVCGASDNIYAARASLHMWEEPCISGNRGSGTVFFSGCPLKCVFCQNKDISHSLHGKRVTAERLCEIFFELKKKGAHNINLVSPTPYIPDIAAALRSARQNGLDLPIVFNSSGYELPEALKLLDGLVDIYLPDFKYMSDELAKKYSLAPDYPKAAMAALEEMVRQRPEPVFNHDGNMLSGVIVRHLVLPGCTDDSRAVIKYLHERYGDSIYISIMSQYTPVGELDRYPELMRKLSGSEYDEVVDYAVELGVTQGFIQDCDSVGESFIPAFDGQGI
ncbi:MAG: radical SAM protein [Clostridia bacterium]|nr:radical SAM protein [Clostridia bacterium]